MTGKDLEVFVDQWVYQSGAAYFNGSFTFNRKRNVVEFELKQDLNCKGVHKYVVSFLTDICLVVYSFQEWNFSLVKCVDYVYMTY